MGKEKEPTVIFKAIDEPKEVKAKENIMNIKIKDGKSTIETPDIKTQEQILVPNHEVPIYTDTTGGF